MAQIDKSHSLSRSKTRRKASLEYRILFSMSFLLFLVALLPGRVIHAAQTVLFGQQDAHKSLLVEAREAANSVLPYAFIG